MDDDDSLLNILSRILQRAGCTVTTAKSGQEARKKVEAQAFDAALIDVRLPDINGLDLLKAFQALAPDMIKIILTGYPSDEDQERALKLGATVYLAKPIKPTDLIRIIDEELKKKGKR